ncbi:MAG: hypothetical protein J5860_04560 [Clostridia bacterium]|nr:hypothetical protein [Clostridia bacterium]
MQKHIDAIRIAAICILLVMLVCFSLIYMNSYRSVKVVSFTAEMDRTVRTTRYREAYIDLIGDKLVSPYFIAFSSEGEKVGFLGDDAYTYYKQIEDVVSAFIGPGAHKYVSEEAAMKYTALSANFIYIRFRCELPTSMIYFMQNPDKIMNDVTDEDYVYDMFIVPTSTGAYAAVRDMRGNYMLCYSEETVRINKTNFLPYNVYDSGLKFEFALEKSADDVAVPNGSSEKISAFELFFDGDLTASSAVVETYTALESEDYEDVLLALGFNPERVSSHESDDGVTYYDEGENVRITNDGHIVYSALSLQYGLGLSDLIGYDFSEGNYTLTDCSGAALVMAHKLGLFNDSGFGLAPTCVEMDGETVVVELSYTYGGFTVMTDVGYAVRMEVTDGRVMSLSCSFAKAHPYAGSTTYAKNDWKLRAAIMGSEGKIDISYVHKIKNGRLYLTAVAFSKEDVK